MCAIGPLEWESNPTPLRCGDTSIGLAIRVARMPSVGGHASEGEEVGANMASMLHTQEQTCNQNIKMRICPHGSDEFSVVVWRGVLSTEGSPLNGRPSPGSQSLFQVLYQALSPPFPRKALVEMTQKISMRPLLSLVITVPGGGGGEVQQPPYVPTRSNPATRLGSQTMPECRFNKLYSLSSQVWPLA